MQKPHFLQAIWEEYHANVRERIDPVYTATRWVKHVVMHRPFRDANRKAFLWAATHFRAFGILVHVDTPEAILFKGMAKNQDFAHVYAWFVAEIAKASASS